jgi:hypothetical protein
MAHVSHAKVLPADLSAPAFVNGWRARGLMLFVLFAVVAVVLAFIDQGGLGLDHLYRAYVVGMMLTFGFCCGGLTLLMVQYVSGGKWGLLLRRPLEAMSRTMPLVFVYWLIYGVFMLKKLYLWAQFNDLSKLKDGLASGILTEGEAHAIEWKHGMLNIPAFWGVGLVCFAIWGFYAWKLNGLSLEREKDTLAATSYWIKRLENISGFGILVYSLTMTAAVIYWVMSMDVTWYSSVYGLLFLVGQGYSVLALSILTTLSLSKAEPIKTILRTTEQYDLGKFTFAFVMLNMYLAFAQFLIIWSGNLPEEIPWYLNRINGHWGVICTLDFMFHWLIPFSLLLSKDIKKNKKRLMRICQWMIFAKAFDLFWLVEPNFKDAARNLHFSWGILEYAAVPAAMVSLWVAYYATNLTTRPLVQINDPHTPEILEPEHAHA